MKRVTLRAATMLAVILMLAFASALASVNAQNNRNVIANIPFEFSVRDKMLPAGEYIVQRITTSTEERLLIRSSDSSVNVIVMTRPVQSNKRQEQAKLVFHRYGNQYFLSQIWKPGEETGRELYKSKSERNAGSELAKTESKAETVVLVASLQ